VLLLNGRLCSGSFDGNVKIWNMETGVCELTVHVTNRLLSGVFQLHHGRLVAFDHIGKVVYHIIGG
jgi:WD40 repeat protein